MICALCLFSLLLATKAGRDPLSLHCCFAPTNRPVVLACDQYEGDYIMQVPFAYFGSVPYEQRMCGADQPLAGDRNATGAAVGDCATARGVHIQHHLSSTCVQQQSCTVQWSDFQHLCSDCSELLVRWVCASDALAAAGTMPQPKVEKSSLLGPLRAQGNQVVDANGQPVRLQGVNWPGLHITHVPSGLDRTPVMSLALRIKALGFNVVRLTWDTHTVQSNPMVPKRLVAANPQFIGMSALQVMEEVIKALETAGVAVWLDNHMLDTDWCCSDNDCNGFWFNAQHQEEDWLEAWRKVAKMSRPYKAVVGAGLKNEIRAMISGKSWGSGPFCPAEIFDRGHENIANFTAATWASGPSALQWRAAAERAGQQILLENPNLLISIGGLDYSSDLRELKNFPKLPKENLVYEAHSYSWQTSSKVVNVALPGSLPGTAPGQSSPGSWEAVRQTCTTLGEACGGVTCAGATDNCYVRRGNGFHEPLRGAVQADRHFSQINRFRTDRSNFATQTDAWWGFLVKENLVPVILTEFGMSQEWQHDPTAKLWFSQISDYIKSSKDGGLDWMYWALIGEQEGGTSRHAGQTETFGILNHCNTAPAATAHIEALQALMSRKEGLLV